MTGPERGALVPEHPRKGTKPIHWLGLAVVVASLGELPVQALRALERA